MEDEEDGVGYGGDQQEVDHVDFEGDLVAHCVAEVVADCFDAGE